MSKPSRPHPSAPLPPGASKPVAKAARDVVDSTRRRVITAVAGGSALALSGCVVPPVPPLLPWPKESTAAGTPPSSSEDSFLSTYEHIDTWLGKPIVNFEMGDSASDGDVIYRLYQEYDTEESQQALVEHFLSQVDPAGLEALIIGPWQVSHDDNPDGILETLIARRGDLVNLRALYVGDIVSEENEISWIIQSNYQALLTAFPNLEVLRIRGGGSLQIPPFELPKLRELALETGGLPSSVVRDLAASKMPALQHLELWLGDDDYGFDGDLATYVALLDAIDPSRLRYLGLRNAKISDELAVHLAKQPWLAKLEVLDLSMGTLGDIGAEALFESPYVRDLERLDLSHHYIGEEWRRKLASLPITVVLDDPQDEDEDDGERYRYVQVAE